MICAPSTQVVGWWTTPIGFLFIDGDHGPQAEHDYLAWSGFLMDGAVLAFHDTAIPPITRACRRATEDGWQERQVVEDCLRVLTR